LATDKTRATWFEAERLAIADVSTLYYCAKSGTTGGDVNREPERESSAPLSIVIRDGSGKPNRDLEIAGSMLRIAAE
jgi:hypothetical protein